MYERIASVKRVSKISMTCVIMASSAFLMFREHSVLLFSGLLSIALLVNACLLDVGKLLGLGLSDAVFAGDIVAQFEEALAQALFIGL
jgi:hypothetical protein